MTIAGQLGPSFIPPEDRVSEDTPAGTTGAPIIPKPTKVTDQSQQNAFQNAYTKAGQTAPQTTQGGSVVANTTTTTGSSSIFDISAQLPTTKVKARVGTMTTTASDSTPQVDNTLQAQGQVAGLIAASIGALSSSMPTITQADPSATATGGASITATGLPILPEVPSTAIPTRRTGVALPAAFLGTSVGTTTSATSAIPLPTTSLGTVPTTPQAPVLLAASLGTLPTTPQTPPLTTSLGAVVTTPSDPTMPAPPTPVFITTPPPLTTPPPTMELPLVNTAQVAVSGTSVSGTNVNTTQDNTAPTVAVAAPPPMLPITQPITTTTTQATTVDTRAQMVALIASVTSLMTQMTTNGQTTTTMTLNSPSIPLFNGVTVTLTQFATAPNQYNVTFSNLDIVSPDARALLELPANQDALRTALIARGYTLQMITLEPKLEPTLPTITAGETGSMSDQATGGGGGTGTAAGGGEELDATV